MCSRCLSCSMRKLEEQLAELQALRQQVRWAEARMAGERRWRSRRGNWRLQRLPRLIDARVELHRMTR